MGYFGIVSVGVQVNQIVKRELQVIYYTIIGLIFAVIFSVNIISAKTLAMTLLPTITGHYWFFTAYIIILCFSKYLNGFLKNLA